jgi:aromatic-amino-acid transaminase
MFERLDVAPADPILGLTETFKKDPTPGKINLGVGVYKDAANKTPVLATVKEAEKRLLTLEDSKSYLPIDGSAEYGAAVQDLLFGADSEVIASGRAATAHTPGGTGALRVVAEFLRDKYHGAKVWVSDPTWVNHIGIFEAAGLDVMTYPYYSGAKKSLKFDAMMKALDQVPAGDAVLLHGCCHNPTGMDPDADQWAAIAASSAKHGWLPFIDFAYQGFSDGIDEDAAGLRAFLHEGSEMLVCSSFSKNFGLYNERVGALTVVAANAEAVNRAMGHIKRSIRVLYSNPPFHGGAIVTTILNDPELRRQWVGEVAAMRDRINAMRQRFADGLQARGVSQDFSFITRQRGMFSFSGLTKAQVEHLREEHAIYIVGSGRINVAGMTDENMDRLCDAIAGVLRD